MLHVYGSLLLLLFAGGVAAWAWLIWRLIARLPVLPREPRRDVPWGLIDLLLAFGLYLLLSLAALAIVHVDRQPKKVTEPGEVVAGQLEPELVEEVRVEMELTLDGWRTMIVLDSSVKLLVMLLVIVIIALRLGATAADLGLSLTHFRADLRIGAITFLAIYLPMIGLQAALVYGLEWKYEHPLIKSVTETKDLLFFSLSSLATAVVAPLFEEFFFRGLLQGWLEKLFAGRATGEQILTGGREELEIELLDPKPNLDQRPFDPNPYAPPHMPEGPYSLAINNVFTRHTPRDWFAILFSMIVFSLLHFSHGPAWIPLLIFGAAIGFVYQATHRLWPGIVAHFLLNATTMLGLWVQVFGKAIE